jgi:hypothetical protein
MARKPWYSIPLKFFWHQLYGPQKKLLPNASDDQIFETLRQNLLNAPLATGETKEFRGLVLSGLELWRADSKGELMHIFFLDKGLRDFLERMPLSDIESIKKYLYENGESKEVLYLNTKSKSNCVVYIFGLHLPFETDGYTFSVSLEEDGAVELYFSNGKNGGRVSDKFYADLNKKDDDHSQTLANMFRLAINTIAYMKCFPDCVTDGVPSDIFIRSENLSAKNVTFQTSEKVRGIESSQVSKMPHFRKGYFKVLQSDYYVHKKGEIIFVAETMVKGSAKTVATSPEIDDFSSKKLFKYGWVIPRNSL